MTFYRLIALKDPAYEMRFDTYEKALAYIEAHDLTDQTHQLHKMIPRDLIKLSFFPSGMLVESLSDPGHRCVIACQRIR